MSIPMNQHQTTEAGPPERRGVLKVVATEEATPMIENANEIVWLQNSNVSQMSLALAQAFTAKWRLCMMTDREVCEFCGASSQISVKCHNNDLAIEWEGVESMTHLYGTPICTPIELDLRRQRK